jgi:nitroreductase
MLRRVTAFHELMNRRRSVRFFSGDPVPRACIEMAIRTACTAPSGAHKQPWTWVAVDRPSIKREIRLAAEEEERRNYLGGRMSPEWRAALQPLGTDWQKPFLEIAPYLVICFAQSYGLSRDGSRIRHYYVQESVGIACGLFLAALHDMGLVTLTHTPSPMGFLARILRRPANERAYLLFPVGYPAADATVPALRRRGLRAVMRWNR